MVLLNDHSWLSILERLEWGGAVSCSLLVGKVGIEPDLNNFIRVALAYQLDSCPKMYQLHASVHEHSNKVLPLKEMNDLIGDRVLPWLNSGVKDPLPGPSGFILPSTWRFWWWIYFKTATATRSAGTPGRTRTFHLRFRRPTFFCYTTGV